MRRGLLALVLSLACSALLPLGSARATVLPSGFHEEVVFSGMEEPMAVSFAADGRVFVAEKAGKVLVFDNLADDTPQVFADLRTEVYDSGDRGIMGMELDPNFPADPYVYVLYTYDAILDPGDPGDPAYAEESKIPRWGTPDTTGDPCPKPPSADVNGCPVSGRLIRLTAGGVGGNQAVAEKELVLGWCQQFISHSVGDLQFDSEGYLYASGGDGAKASTTDHGQFGWPKKNQCGDPPGGIGGTMEPPTAEGGALRSQDPRTPNPLGNSADPTGLNGSIIRVDPETGAGVPGNPLFGSLDANERRIVAYGFRNPFRFAIDETDEVYVSNVGWTEWEEIDRFTADAEEPWNSGWPCYEGPEVNIAYRNLETNLCEDLYAEPGATGPSLYSYSFGGPLFPGDPCTTEQGAAITGISVYRDDAFPEAYEGALFFADSVRECIYVMLPGEDGKPDPSTTTIFAYDAGFYPAVDLEIGPDGNLYYVNLFTASEGGTLRQVSYDPGSPDAELTATPTFGAADPLEVDLDAGGSTDPDGEDLTYDWDLDGDGSFETLDGGPERTEDISGPDPVRIGVRVKDEGGATNVAQVLVHPGNTPPQPQIDEPLSSMKWKVGQKIDFSGAATDPQDGGVPDEDLHWRIRLHHCRDVGDCHAHPLQVLPSLEEGSFTAPDHEYPAYLEIILTATDSQGLSAVDSVEIQPRTVDLQIASNPTGLTLSAGVKSGPAPFTVTAIEGSDVGLSAPLSQELGGETYDWSAWSQGGPNVQNVTANASTTYTALYTLDGGPLEFPLELTKDGDGQGTVTSAPAGIACGPICTQEAALFPDGEEVTLSQSPASGSEFGGWSGCEEEVAGSCHVTVDEALEVEATFNRSSEQPGGSSQPDPPGSTDPPLGPPAPPRTRIEKHPAKRTESSTARFRFSAANASAGASFECKLDRRPFVRCRSPRTYRNLAPGRHLFKVIATVGGVEDSTPAVFRWRVLPDRDR